MYWYNLPTGFEDYDELFNQGTNTELLQKDVEWIEKYELNDNSVVYVSEYSEANFNGYAVVWYENPNSKSYAYCLGLTETKPDKADVQNRYDYLNKVALEEREEREKEREKEMEELPTDYVKPSWLYS